MKRYFKKGFPMVIDPRIKKDVYTFPNDYISLKQANKILKGMK